MGHPRQAANRQKKNSPNSTERMAKETAAAEFSSKDYEMARRAMDRHWPHLTPETPKHKAYLKSLAGFHAFAGTANFELRYCLREPQDYVEELTQKHMHGQLTDEELGEKLKADALRPVDDEMLRRFGAWIESHLE